jgi:hypothetical protein
MEYLTEKYQSLLPKKGEGDAHEIAVLRLQEISNSIGYDSKKDHNINERIIETSSFFDDNCRVKTQLYRLDLVLKRNKNYIINEVDGSRHETKIVQGKDGIKTEDVLNMLRKQDPIFIRWKIESLIGKYKQTDEQIKNILNSPKRFHLSSIS